MEDLIGRVQQLDAQLRHQADVIEQLRNAQSNRERNILKPPQYSDDKSDVPYQVWQQNFQEVALVNNWSGNTGIRAAKASLKGKAATRAFDLNPNDYMTLPDFLQALQTRFLPRSRANLAKCHFETCSQKPGESIGDWHSRAKILYIHQDPSANVNSSELIRRFVGGLYNRKDIMKAIFRANPQTYDAALQLAEDGEAADKQCDFYTTSTQVHNPYPGFEPMEIGAMQPLSNKATADCIACGKQGHDANNCWSIPKMRKFFEEYGPTDKDFQRPPPTKRFANNRRQSSYDQRGPRMGSAQPQSSFPRGPRTSKPFAARKDRVNALLAALATEIDEQAEPPEDSDTACGTLHESQDWMAEPAILEQTKNEE